MVNLNISGLNHQHGSRKKHHSSVGIHPYLRLDFWNNPLNHFWNSELYSEESKDHFIKWLQELNDKHHLHRK